MTETGGSIPEYHLKAYEVRWTSTSLEHPIAFIIADAAFNPEPDICGECWACRNDAGACYEWPEGWDDNG